MMAEAAANTSSGKWNIFITGSTGYIGQKLTLKLAENGHVIHALVRDLEKARLLLNHVNIILFEGDLMDKPSILKAMKGCRQAYHLAALASVWHKNPFAFYESNVIGLKNVLDCCLEMHIKDVLFTSTAGVVGESKDGQPVAEQTNHLPTLETLYEKSKVIAEKLLQDYNQKGIRGIIVNPSRVYGPGLLTESNGFTRLLKMYLNGKWRIKPGDGKSIGNYVFIEDVINGILLAMEKATPGERYLLGGINTSYTDFFKLVDELTGIKRKMFNFPLPAMLFVAYLQLFMAKLFGKQPLITPPFVKKYNKDWIVNSAKAEIELGYIITPLKVGIEKTITWLESNNSFVNFH